MLSARTARNWWSPREGQSLHVWDLRAVRDELAQRGLDWDLPPYPPAGDSHDAPPLRVTVDLGDLQKTIHHENEKDPKEKR